MSEATQVTHHPDILEKARQIAEEIILQGAKVVILSGSAARGKEKPNDLDFMVWGRLPVEIKALTENLSQKIGIKVQLFVFSKEYIDSLVKAYRANKDWLGVQLAMMSQDASERHLSWPLIPLLSEEEFQYFFGQFLGYVGNGHLYLTREYIILKGQDYIETKRKELNTAKEKIITPQKLKIIQFFIELSGSQKKRSS